MKKFPSPIIMKHPSGMVKSLNRTIVTLLAFFLGVFYYGIVGLWSFVGWHFLIILCSIPPALASKSNDAGYVTLLFGFFFAFCFFGLPFMAYQARCRLLYEQGFRMVDKDGNLIDS